MSDSPVRRYDPRTSAVFCRTTEEFGGLSNMAAGFPVVVNGHRFRTAEALYQACRFPDRPDIQEKILQQTSPMSAKYVSREYESFTRVDWLGVRYKIMYWCISVKLLQNWDNFYSLLQSTGTRPIVELSVKDQTWGARPDGGFLIGINALGRLLMKLREEYVFNGARPDIILPPPVENFKLFGEDVGSVSING